MNLSKQRHLSKFLIILFVIIVTLLITRSFSENKESLDVVENTKEKQRKQENTNRKSNSLKYPKETKLQIGLLSLPGSKIIHPKESYGIKYGILNKKDPGERGILKKGYYDSLSHHYDKNIDKNYTFEKYRDDMLFYRDIDGFSLDEIKNYDYIFIPPIGFRIDDDFNENLIAYMETNNIKKTDEMCYIQLFTMKNDKKIKSLMNNENYFIPLWPEKHVKQIEGILFPPTLYDSVFWMFRFIHYLNRVDVVFQHYCEIFGKKVYIPNEDYFKLDYSIFN